MLKNIRILALTALFCGTIAGATRANEFINSASYGTEYLVKQPNGQAYLSSVASVKTVYDFAPATGRAEPFYLESIQEKLSDLNQTTSLRTDIHLADGMPNFSEQFDILLADGMPNFGTQYLWGQQAIIAVALNNY